MRKLNSKGFTIIELLIATVTFSVILLVISGAIIQFTKLYYKGTITTQTQEASRAIINDITRNIQFATPGSIQHPDPENGVEMWCIGGQKYMYRLDTQVGGTGADTKHALVVDSDDGSCTNPDGDINQPLENGRSELLGDRMKLLGLSITKNQNLYTVNVRVGYGDEVDSNGKCPSISLGGQFCTSSELSTTVIGRL